MNFTPAQAEAIAARGNVLVVAGAGTGKTKTLVARCLSCLMDEKVPASLEEILMVTFTEAAAAEMRQRIRAELEKKVSEGGGKASHWLEQLALFETAHIGTLHGFCLQLVRQHFYELELDPQLTVMAEEEATLLADETMQKIFEAHYAGETPNAEAVQQLIQTQARGWDLPIRSLVMKLHHYTQTLRDPEAWFAEQLAMYQSSEPEQWRVWLLEGFAEWRERWLLLLRREAKENPKAAECATILEKISTHPLQMECAGVLKQVCEVDVDWPSGKRTAWRTPLADFFAEALFLHSLTRTDGKAEPLAQDWEWARAYMRTLLELAREFTTEFSKQKRELGAVDFHDLEQHALRLLWDRATKQPSATAREWRKKLHFIFVDEYQDINEAQDAILKALSSEDEFANRFLVGDVKQSIYRFRLADPHIFQNYIDTWRGAEGHAIPLVDNFRSREGLLHFVNSLFAVLMRREIGGVTYDDEARLHFGDAENRTALSAASDDAPRVELHLRVRTRSDANAVESEGESSRAWTEVLNLEESAKEARLTALRLRELKTSGHLVCDKDSGEMRPVEWKDMAVLLRSPSGKVESYAREFSRLDVPLTVARGGFYESLEITDLLSLLQMLDNPLQDLPVLAALRSPLAGMTIDELATIRLCQMKSPFWIALHRYHQENSSDNGWSKVDRFLKNFARWRRLARQVSLSRCLEAVLDDTHYAAWLLTQPCGEQRHANVQRLLSLAQQFDQFQRQGLFRFLRFIEAQQAAETEPQVAPVSGDDAVALMSIHQSKGLEFPVVVVGDLGKPFNMSDLATEIILDSRYGLCPQVKPPQSGQRYPSLPYWLARQRQKQEMLGEEVRLLYVAMTRARDTLILTGSVAEGKFHKHWLEGSEVGSASLLAARNYLDWLGAWSVQEKDARLSELSGRNTLWSWTIYDDLDERLLDENSPKSDEMAPEETIVEMDEAAWRKFEEKISWEYPHMPTTKEPAKTSVTILRRQVEAENVEARPMFAFRKRSGVRKLATPAKLSAVEIGNAHHTFLEFVALERTGTMTELKEQAERLRLEELLSKEEIANLDFKALAAFWGSELGSRIRAQAKYVKRELPFTARFSPNELPGQHSGVGETEFVIVQGVADLVILLPEEIWLIDFKTDQINADDVSEKAQFYEVQLRLYALALGRIYSRPVSRAYLHFIAVNTSVELTADLKTGHAPT